MRYQFGWFGINNGICGDAFVNFMDYQNEIYATYRNEALDVTVPDLVCMIDANGNPITIPDFEIGSEMNAIALPAPELWKTEKGLEIFGPRHFGVDADYVPFKK